MFDIGFPELMLVSVVALLVIGPERLPETIRSIMLWLGRLRRSFTNIKAELEQEIGADEIKRQLHNETIMKDLEQSRQSIQDVIDESNESIADLKHNVSNPLRNDEAGSKPDSDRAEPRTD